MSRFAERHRVFFVEEPIEREGEPRLDVTERACGALVVVPQLPPGGDSQFRDATQHILLLEFVQANDLHHPVLWYYTPMALGFTQGIPAAAVVYDCMDELSAFQNPPPGLKTREAELLQQADLVFAGGRSLYHAKRAHHRCTHLFPSSVDVQHFDKARRLNQQRRRVGARHLRVGYIGVVDERMDLDLLRGTADARPEWELVIIGPVVKIDQAKLPQGRNIQYLGYCAYADLPRHLATWDVAMIPFAEVAATEFVSPTKLLEYMAAGLPVVSTPIRDVIEPYGMDGVVQVATTLEDWLVAVEKAVNENPAVRLRRYEAVLAQTSWNCTWSRMADLLGEVLTRH